MPVDIDATTDLLFLIQQKLRIVQYRYGSRVVFPSDAADAFDVNGEMQLLGYRSMAKTI